MLLNQDHRNLASEDLDKLLRFRTIGLAKEAATRVKTSRLDVTLASDQNGRGAWVLKFKNGGLLQFRDYAYLRGEKNLTVLD